MLVHQADSLRTSGLTNKAVNCALACCENLPCIASSTRILDVTNGSPTEGSSRVYPVQHQLSPVRAQQRTGLPMEADAELPSHYSLCWEQHHLHVVRSAPYAYACEPYACSGLLLHAPRFQGSQKLYAIVSARYQDLVQKIFLCLQVNFCAITIAGQMMTMYIAIER